MVIFSSKWFYKRDVFVLLALVLFKSSILGITIISGLSMSPSLAKGEWVVINQSAYSIRVPFTQEHLTNVKCPERGDIVVFRSTSELTQQRVAKRVVGLPMDTIKVDGTSLYVNGELVTLGITSDEEGHVFVEEELNGRRYQVMYDSKANPAHKAWQNGTWTVSDGEVFVLGDNRLNSLDSRHGELGSIPLEFLIGKVI